MKKQNYKKISVDIFGTKYSLRTDSDPEYVHKLGQMVDERMRKVSLATHSFSGMHIGVLTALELADEYCKLKKQYDDLLELMDY